MSKLSLFRFIVRPSEVVRGVRKLGPAGAALHGLRRVSAGTERALLGPAQLRLNPMGAVCNHTCPMCWLQHMPAAQRREMFKSDQRDGLDLGEYERLLASTPRGLSSVNVAGGGEPLVHPDCVDILAAIKRRRLRGYLITNGSLLNAATAERMVAMEWDLVRVSVHAGDRETYRAMQGVDHFDRVVQNLVEFDRRRRAERKAKTCQLQVHHVLQRGNLDSIPSMLALAEQVGADRVVFEMIFALSADKRLTRGELEAAARDLRAAAAQAQTPSNAAEIASDLDRAMLDAPSERLAANPSSSDDAPTAAASQAFPPPDGAAQEPPFRPANRCSVGFDSVFLNSNGDVLPCCFSNEVMGNIRDQSFSDIWFGPLYADFRARLIRGEFASYCAEVRCQLRMFLHD